MNIKNKIIFLFLLFLGINCSSPIQQTADSIEGSYSKNDLQKIKWIEGMWKGLDGETPFYEIYKIINDTTLMITSYDWNGTDSSNTSYDYVQWKEDAYYLGKNQNYKTVSMSEREIKMIPIKASNDITWRLVDSNSWEAILAGKKATKKYHMQRFDPFTK
ncbi:MAG TPA: hypothetical protein VJY62_16260 [Bacteroidia bacterium]|nr:hypothetical protein [Bacteroidia bacterium]